MILLPAFTRVPGGVVYGDSERPELRYVDAGDLQSVGMAGSAGDGIDWRPSQSLLEAVRPVPGADLGGVPADGLRALALPWEQVHVATWTLGPSPELLSSPVPVPAGHAPARLRLPPHADELPQDGVQTAVLLRAPTQLDRAVVRGHVTQAGLEALARALDSAADQAPPMSLGCWLTNQLSVLLSDRLANLQFKAARLPIVAMEDLRRLALLSWAEAITAASGQPATSLLLPLSSAVELKPALASTKLHWKPGDALTLLRLRHSHPPEPAPIRPSGARLQLAGKDGEPMTPWGQPSPAHAPVSAPDNSPAARLRLHLALAQGTSWDRIWFVQLALRAPELHADVTLTQAEPSIACLLPGDCGGPIVVTAEAGVRGHTARLALPAPRRVGDGFVITVPDFVEAALVVRAEPALLAETGPLVVHVDHPALAERSDAVIDGIPLCARPDGRRASEVWGGFLWKDGAREDYRLTLRGGGAPQEHRASVDTSCWTADGATLPRLRVVALDGPAEVEAAEGHHPEGLTPLGRRRLAAGAFATWLIGTEPCWLRAVAVTKSGDSAESSEVLGPWLRAGEAGVQRAPTLQPRPITVLLPTSWPGPVDIDLAPSVAAGGHQTLRLSPGEVAHVTVIDARGSAGCRFRTRPAKTGPAATAAASATAATGWTPWQVSTGPAVVPTPTLPAASPKEESPAPC